MGVYIHCIYGASYTKKKSLYIYRALCKKYICRKSVVCVYV